MLCSSETSIDGFWGSKIVKGSVGQAGLKNFSSWRQRIKNPKSPSSELSLDLFEIKTKTSKCHKFRGFLFKLLYGFMWCQNKKQLFQIVWKHCRWKASLFSKHIFWQKNLGLRITSIYFLVFHNTSHPSIFLFVELLSAEEEEPEALDLTNQLSRSIVLSSSRQPSRIRMNVFARDQIFTPVINCRDKKKILRPRVVDNMEQRLSRI